MREKRIKLCVAALGRRKKMRVYTNITIGIVGALVGLVLVGQFLIAPKLPPSVEQVAVLVVYHSKADLSLRASALTEDVVGTIEEMPRIGDTYIAKIKLQPNQHYIIEVRERAENTFSWSSTPNVGCSSRAFDSWRLIADREIYTAVVQKGVDSQSWKIQTVEFYENTNLPPLYTVHIRYYTCARGEEYTIQAIHTSGITYEKQMSQTKSNGCYVFADLQLPANDFYSFTLKQTQNGSIYPLKWELMAYIPTDNIYVVV